MNANDIKNLYTTSEIETMKLADNARIPGKNRVEEIKNYARLSGIRKIGIANCISMQKETEVLKSMFGSEFEVHSINCKVGKIPSSVFNTDSKGMSCNPAAQAQYLHENNTELNISVGLCVGHDMVFTSKSKVPVTTLIVKDREHKNSSMEIFK